MSLLTIITAFAERTGVAIPSSVMGTTDVQIKQARALLEEECIDLSLRGIWQSLTLEAAHTTVSAEDQGAITAIAPNGFRFIKNDTIWDRTDTLPVLGPMTGETWQTLKATVSTGPRYHYRIRGGRLLVTPTPAAGHDWRFEYVSSNWVLGADGTSYRSSFALDTDTILLPEYLVTMGLRWRWMREKGQDYAELFRTYEMQVKDALGRDGGKPTIYMDESSRRKVPGVFVPQYNAVS